MFAFLDRLLARRYPGKTEAEIRAEVEARRAQAGRKVAARFTRGNTNIQDGRFLTKIDLENRHAPPS